MSTKKNRRTFVMKDVDDVVIGKGVYYTHGGNVQLVYHKYTPNAGALQFHSIGEILLLKGVHSVQWDHEQETEVLFHDGWYKKVNKDDDGWNAEVSFRGRTDIVIPMTTTSKAVT